MVSLRELRQCTHAYLHGGVIYIQYKQSGRHPARQLKIMQYQCKRDTRASLSSSLTAASADVGRGTVSEAKGKLSLSLRSLLYSYGDSKVLPWVHRPNFGDFCKLVGTCTSMAKPVGETTLSGHQGGQTMVRSMRPSESKSKLPVSGSPRKDVPYEERTRGCVTPAA